MWCTLVLPSGWTVRTWRKLNSDSSKLSWAAGRRRYEHETMFEMRSESVRNIQPAINKHVNIITVILTPCIEGVSSCFSDSESSTSSFVSSGVNFTFLHFSLWLPSVVPSALTSSLWFLSESHFYINIPPGRFKSFAFFMCFLFFRLSLVSSLFHCLQSFFPTQFFFISSFILPPSPPPISPLTLLVPPVLLHVSCTNTGSTLYCVLSYLSICCWWFTFRTSFKVSEYRNCFHLCLFLSTFPQYV